MLGCATNQDSLLFLTLRYISTTMRIFFQKVVGGRDPTRVWQGSGGGSAGVRWGLAGVWRGSGGGLVKDVIYCATYGAERIFCLVQNVTRIEVHCKCLQGITGSLRGNQSAGISNLWGLHVYPQSL